MEVDGPAHFILGGSERVPKGSTLLKRRQLEQLGYTAVSVPHWEWYALKGKSKEQLQLYLRGKLRIDQKPQHLSSLPDGKGGLEVSGGTVDCTCLGGEGQMGRPSSRLKGLTKREGGGHTMGVCP